MEISEENGETFKNEEISEKKEDSSIILNPDTFFNHLKGTLDNISFQIQSILQLGEDEDSIIANVSRFIKTLNFKVTNIILSLLELEKEILASPLDQYYHSVLNMDYYTLQTNNKVERLTDSILTQYFSIADIFIKFMTKTKNISKDLDSLGSLYHYQDKNELSEQQKKIFEPFLLDRQNFEQIKAYRDFLVHHSTVNVEPVREQILNNMHPIQSYYMNVVRKGKGKKYTKSKKTQQKVNVFLRYHLAILLESVAKCLDEMRQEYFDRED